MSLVTYERDDHVATITLNRPEAGNAINGNVRNPTTLDYYNRGNLDPATSVGIMKLLDRINRTGTTVLMATHDHHIVDSMRQRVVELELGRLVRDEQRGVYGMDR